AEGDRRPDVVGGLFARYVPGDVFVRGDLVQDAVIPARLRPGDDRLEPVLRQAEERVERVEDFRRVADGHEHFRHGRSKLARSASEEVRMFRWLPRWRFG